MPIPFRITINAASSQSRVAKFVKAIDSGKNAAIEEVLRSSTDGLLTPVGRAGFKLGLVLIQEVETGQLIVGITDRPIWPFPNVTQLQVHGYEFGVVYLRLDKNGSGTGDMVPFSKILPDPRNGFKVERKIEETIRLNSVQLSSDEMKDEKR